MTKKMLPILILLILLPFVIGGAFSYFLYDEPLSNNNKNNVSIGITDTYELGAITLYYGDDESDELASNLKNKIYFGYDKVLILRSDNLSTDRKYKIKYLGSENFSIPDNCTIGLSCTIKVEDTDARGIKQKTITSQDGMNYNYYYSESIIDYFKAVDVSFDSTNLTNQVFTKNTDTDFDKTIVYTCSVFDDITKVMTNGYLPTFAINLDYQKYKLNGEDNELSSLEPSSFISTKETFEGAYNSAKESMKNSKISITFKLVLNQN